ncbi:MAG: hypothetical protein A49_18310 [Methyloceanibacter sp.]|nr:MAG: hypothetical protein A49_18310 [Methyloceanibacter sp.]
MLPDTESIDALAAEIAEKLDSDILFINHFVGLRLDMKVYSAAISRPNRADKLILVLVTEGGNADTGYRCMRYLQALYKEITVVVPGWCKSAGTLMCTGAHKLQIGPLGELGPLDVQLRRRDTLGEVSSGLAIDTAIEKLQREASKTFMRFIEDAEQSDYRMSLKSASQIAQTVTIGLFGPVFAKLEPISIGEDYRAYKIAEAYAQRLNSVAKNLQRSRDYDGLQALLEAFPSHGFVIDEPEARSIFCRVSEIDSDIQKLTAMLGFKGLFPMDRDAGKNEIDYLNKLERATHDTDRGSEASPPRRARRGRGSAKSAAATPTKQARPSRNSKKGNGPAAAD